MDLQSAETVLWYANIGATVVLLILLLLRKLWRVYPFLFTYLLTDAVQQIVGVAVRNLLDKPKRPYFYVYVAGQTLKMLLAVFVVRELARVGLAKYPALAVFARKTASAMALLVAGVAMLGLFLAPPALGPNKNTNLEYFYAFERAMDGGVLLLLVGVTVFVSWFPVKLPRNVAYYIGGFCTFFMARVLGLLAVSRLEKARAPISVGELALSLVCLGAMAYSMRPQGERETVTPGHSWDAAAMERMTRQLEEMNSSLTRGR